MYKLMTRF